MITKTITYTNYAGEKVTEEARFHLSADELIELQVSEKEGFAEAVQAMVETENAKEILKHFRNIILMSYGRMSADGRRFAKETPSGERLALEFVETGAYSQLFVDMFSNADLMSAFMEGILPHDAQEVAARIAKGAGVDSPPAVAPVAPVEVTDEQLLAMDPQEMTTEQLRRAMQLKVQKPAS